MLAIAVNAFDWEKGKTTRRSFFGGRSQSQSSRSSIFSTSFSAQRGDSDGGWLANLFDRVTSFNLTVGKVRWEKSEKGKAPSAAYPKADTAITITSSASDRGAGVSADDEVGADDVDLAERAETLPDDKDDEEGALFETEGAESMPSAAEGAHNIESAMPDEERAEEGGLLPTPPPPPPTLQTDPSDEVALDISIMPPTAAPGADPSD
jgi:hypothetical protein